MASAIAMKNYNDRVTVAISDGIADVRLDRADKRNALDPAMFDAIAKAGQDLITNREIRAVVLSGNGNSFCAGLDFGSFQSMADSGKKFKRECGGDATRCDHSYGATNLLGVARSASASCCSAAGSRTWWRHAVGTRRRHSSCAR